MDWVAGSHLVFKGISLFSDNYVIVAEDTLTGIHTAYDDRVWFNDVTKG